MEEGKKRHRGKTSEVEKEVNVKEDTQEKQSSKRKGKGKKGKKGKGRGKKSNREASEKDKTALKTFLDSFKGSRRLMVRSFSFLRPFPPLFFDSGLHIVNATYQYPIIYEEWCVCLCCTSWFRRPAKMQRCTSSRRRRTRSNTATSLSGRSPWRPLWARDVTLC